MFDGAEKVGYILQKNNNINSSIYVLCTGININSITCCVVCGGVLFSLNRFTLLAAVVREIVGRNSCFANIHSFIY